jgi:hypothetical protein
MEDYLTIKKGTVLFFFEKTAKIAAGRNDGKQNCPLFFIGLTGIGCCDNYQE